MSKLRCLVAFVVTMALGLPTLVGLLLVLPSRATRIRLAGAYGKLVAYTTLPIFGIRPLLEGGEHLDGRRPCVYVVNHSANLDPFVGLWCQPVGTVGVAKTAIGRIPIFGQVYWLSGHVLLDRSHTGRAVGSLDAAARLVRENGLSLWIWPEGTQPHDGRLLPFKKGFVHLALAAGLPVVPVIFHDAHRLWPARTLDVVPGDLRVQVLPPIDTRDWTVERAEEHAETVRQVFLDHMAEHQHPLVEAAG